MTARAHPPAFLLDALREGIQVIGPDWCYRYVNPAAARHGNSTPEALIGRTMMACYPGIERTPLFAELEQCLRSSEPCVLENVFQYADGSCRYFELRIEPVPDGVCVLSIDITDRKVAEAHAKASEDRLRHGERLESIGRLSAGIAHDFNNLLGVVLGQGELALERPSGPMASDVELMVDVARRSAVLTRQLLAFGRRQVMQSTTLDPHGLVRGLADILRRTLGPTVDLALVMADEVGMIEVDASKLEQVLMNLVINARDAMPAGGHITIELARVAQVPEQAQRSEGGEPGPHVVISVRDDGVGMDESTRARVFEPFFTTKPPGSGTGLGLATVHGIVLQSHGAIEVDSAPGQGTTFKLYFPQASTASVEAASAEAASAEAASAEAVDTEAPGVEATRAREAEEGEHEGDETVLLVEDHASLRAMAEATLDSAGYRVIAVGAATQALTRLAADLSIALVVTDVVMPGMRGPELIVRARALRPELKFLCTSGHASDSLGDQALPADVPFLEKPYLPSTLLRTVREILDGRR